MALSLSSPLKIGDLQLDRRLLMAPLAGLTKSPFRRLVRRWGAGLVFTEMIASQGIAHGNRRTLEYLRCGEDEHPIGYQIFGAVPEVMAEAARACVAAGADLIDLNMACPVRKVMKTGAGAALLGEPELAERIVAAVVAALPRGVPVTVKLRAGLRPGDEAGRRLAPRLVAAGAAAITLHPRTAAQLYRGRADHTLTLALAGELTVPVIASGDVGLVGPQGAGTPPADAATPPVPRGESSAVHDGWRAAEGHREAVARVAAEGCARLLDGGVAAVMLARAALGRPWLFAEILYGTPAPSRAVRLKEMRGFVDEVAETLGDHGVGYLRQFWPRLRKGGAITSEEARELMQARHMAEVAEVLAAAGRLA